MKRLIEILIVLFISTIIFLPSILLIILIKIETRGPALYWSQRVGKNSKIFLMPKFRSMKLDTPEVATSILNSEVYITRVGNLIRKSSIDELPQLFSILKGDMSFIGPRPALFNQDDLITLRTEKGVDKLIPGLTGWAQINGRDELPIPQKVDLDVEYLHHQSLWLDIKIIWLTFIKVLKRDGVSH